MKFLYHDDFKHFDNWIDLLEYVKEPSTVTGVLQKQAASIQSKYNGGYAWYGTNSFEEAYELGMKGWKEGQDEALKISQPLIERMVNFIERPDIMYDVEGIGIDMGRFNAGDPEPFIRFQTEIVEVQAMPRLIRIVFNNSASAGIPKETITAKGAVITVLVELLEFAGHRVEVINLPYCVRGSGAEGKAGITYMAGVKVKPFDQPLEMARLMFAMAHPSMLRRFGFRIAEKTSPECQKSLEWGYGIPADPTPECLEEYGYKADLFIQSQGSWQVQWTNAESTQKWLIQTLKEQGVKLKTEDIPA